LAPDLAHDLHGEASATLEAKGRVSGEAPSIDRASASVRELRVWVPGFELKTEHPFTIARGSLPELKVEGLELVSEQRRLALAGTLGLGSSRSDLTLRGTTDLRVARSFLSQAYTSGTLRLDARVQGVWPDI